MYSGACSAKWLFSQEKATFKNLRGHAWSGSALGARLLRGEGADNRNHETLSAERFDQANEPEDEQPQQEHKRDKPSQDRNEHEDEAQDPDNNQRHPQGNRLPA